MSETARTEKQPLVYDADARARFEFEVSENGQKFDTAHIFDPLSDERYLIWIEDFKVSVVGEKVSEETRQATLDLWNDLIAEVENIEVEDGQSWKGLIDEQERLDAVNDFLAVAIADNDDEPKATGKRKLSPDQTQVIYTECYVFNTETKKMAVARQTHVLPKNRSEWQKRYERIQAKRFKTEQTRGLRRKPKVEFVPQDAAVGELYDEMKIKEPEGFASRVPLRFKTTVIHHIFESSLSQKK